MEASCGVRLFQNKLSLFAPAITTLVKLLNNFLLLFVVRNVLELKKVSFVSTFRRLFV